VGKALLSKICSFKDKIKLPNYVLLVMLLSILLVSITGLQADVPYLANRLYGRWLSITHLEEGIHE
jgi:hypothetical protein